MGVFFNSFPPFEKKVQYILVGPSRIGKILLLKAWDDVSLVSEYLLGMLLILRDNINNCHCLKMLGTDVSLLCGVN